MGTNTLPAATGAWETRWGSDALPGAVGQKLPFSRGFMGPLNHTKMDRIRHSHPGCKTAKPAVSYKHLAGASSSLLLLCREPAGRSREMRAAWRGLRGMCSCPPARLSISSRTPWHCCSTSEGHFPASRLEGIVFPAGVQVFCRNVI